MINLDKFEIRYWREKAGNRENWKRLMKNINQLSGKGVDLRRVASLVHRLHRVTSSPAQIPLKDCNLLICLFTGVQ